MADQLVNATCGNGYTSAAEATFQLATWRVRAIVANQAVFYQVRLAVPGLRAQAAGDWRPEQYLTPGAGDLTFPAPIVGIRFRNAVSTATAAQVTANAT